LSGAEASKISLGALHFDLSCDVKQMRQDSRAHTINIGLGILLIVALVDPHFTPEAFRNPEESMMLGQK
jgi:hypothetical protein